MVREKKILSRNGDNSFVMKMKWMIDEVDRSYIIRENMTFEENHSDFSSENRVEIIWDENLNFVSLKTAMKKRKFINFPIA